MDITTMLKNAVESGILIYHQRTQILLQREGL